MAAPVAAKVAVSATRSKTGQRVIVGLLAMFMLIFMSPSLLMVAALGASWQDLLCENPAVSTVSDVTIDTTIDAVKAKERLELGMSIKQARVVTAIIKVGKEKGLSKKATRIALMTALVESDLRNLANKTVPESLKLPNDGTAEDHDSVGVFQQRPSQGWGSVKDLMTPAKAAAKFYDALEKVKGWEDLDPGAAAQAVQRSAFPDRYAEQSDKATKILIAYTDVLDNIGSNISLCDVGAEVVSSGGSAKVKGGFAHPLDDKRFSSSTRHDVGSHGGGAIDIAAPAGTPVYAVAAGKVYDLSESCGGTVIGVQHNNKYTTAYAHLGKVNVKDGQQVKAGQQIGVSGLSGSCVNGAHLHFEVRTGSNPRAYGSFYSAAKFMRENGVPLGGSCTGPFC